MTEPTETAKQVNPIWKCEVKNCDIAYPPTLTGYRQMQGHQLKHANEGVPKGKRRYHLADESTGEVLARSINEAMPFLVLETTKETKKVEPPISETPPKEVPEVPKAPSVIDLDTSDARRAAEKVEIPEKPPKETPPEAEIPKEIPEAEEVATKSKVATVKSVGIFTYEITLPADAFVLFDLAKACGLEENDEKLFDEWVWDCIRKRYEKDYKKQLVLAPMEE